MDRLIVSFLLKMQSTESHPLALPKHPRYYATKKVGRSRMRPANPEIAEYGF